MPGLGPCDKSILNTGTAVQRTLGSQHDHLLPHFSRRPCCLLGARSPFVSPFQHKARCGPTLHFQPDILRAWPYWREGAVSLFFSSLLTFHLLLPIENRHRVGSGLHCLTVCFVPWLEAPPGHFSRLILRPLQPPARLLGSRPQP